MSGKGPTKRDGSGRFQKGTPKVPGSGRKLGDSGRQRALVHKFCQDHGVDPMEFFALVVKRDKGALKALGESNISMKHRIDAAVELSKRMYPELKPVDNEMDAKVIADLEKAKLEVQKKEEELRLMRFERERLERAARATGSGHLENRPLPVEAPGRGPCGIYHSALDETVYPEGPLVLTPPDPELPCPICGKSPIHVGDIEPGAVNTGSL